MVDSVEPWKNAWNVALRKLLNCILEARKHSWFIGDFVKMRKARLNSGKKSYL